MPVPLQGVTALTLVRMFALRQRRRLLIVGAACVIAALGLQSPGAAVTTDARKHPRGAARLFHWGAPRWDDESETPTTKSPPMSPDWAINARSLVKNRWGQMLITGRPDGREVRVTLTGHPHRYGRWEVKVFTHQIKSSSPYRIFAELIPAGSQAYRCGAKNITLADHVMGTHRTRMSIRTLPNRQFSYSARPYLGPWDFNTYGVEITKTHISWFMDDRVVMTERRPAALAGTLYTLRLRLVGNGATDVTPPRMQLDWSRYFTLQRPNTRSIAAPQAHLGTYSGAC